MITPQPLARGKESGSVSIDGKSRKKESLSLSERMKMRCLAASWVREKRTLAAYRGKRSRSIFAMDRRKGGQPFRLAGKNRARRAFVGLHAEKEIVRSFPSAKATPGKV